MQGLIIVYPLFVRDLAEVKALADTHLVPDRRQYIPDEKAKIAWQEEEAKRYDQFMRLAMVSTLKATVSALDSSMAGAENNVSIGEEAGLLRGLWLVLQEARDYQTLICGWKIREDIWPRLINRSLALNVDVPDWAKPNISRRWFDVELHDIAMIYSCGVWDRARPLPALDHALRFWLGREYPSETNTKLLAEVKVNDPEVEAAVRLYLAGMAEIWLRYARKTTIGS